MDQQSAAPVSGLAASKWPRPQRGRDASPFKLPRPRLSGPQTRGYEEIPKDARDFIDSIIGFHGMDAVMMRRQWLDTARHGKIMRLSWVIERSMLEPAQVWRHTFVRHALDHIVVRAGGVLILESPFSDPLELYAYRLTLEPGARVETRGASPVRLVVGQLVGAPPDADADAAPAEILVAGEDGRPGLPGGPGQCGEQRFSVSTDGPPDGGPGSGGGHGGPGTAGQSLREFTLIAHTLTGLTHLTVRPGAGGPGGPGGPGGCGAIGGAVAFYRMAAGGEGGAGGAGGCGGAGGDASEVRLDIRTRQPGADLCVTAEPGRGGAGGAGGAGGRAGIGCPDGKPGKNGCDGDRGTDGAAPDVRWI